MTFRSDLRTEIANRLGDSGAIVWDTADLNGYIDYAIKGVYPTYFLFDTATTTAAVGPMQTLPVGARNLYFVGHKRALSTRVRVIRNWREGAGVVMVPKTGIAADTLVFSWTKGFLSPGDDVTLLDLTPEAQEVVLMRCEIAALENLLSSRIKQAKYFTLTVREGVTEEDIATTIDALHASIRQRIESAPKLPERVG